MTFDEASIILSKNKTDLGSSQRQLLEETSNRQISTRQNQVENCDDINLNQNINETTITMKKNPSGRKIQFNLE